MNVRAILSLFTLVLLAGVGLACRTPAERQEDRVDRRVDRREERREERNETPGATTAAQGNRKAAVDEERDLTYCTGGGVDLKMNVYHPAPGDVPAPAIMFVHGGGWIAGDKDQAEVLGLFAELADRGYFVAVINYRLAPQDKFPAAIEDVKCAVRHLRANAELYGIDPNRIGAWGGSAGGHLVDLLGTTDDSAGMEGAGGYTSVSSRVQAVVSMYGPTDLTTLYAGHERIAAPIFGSGSAEVLARFSPITYVTPDDPPFLILQGEEDRLVPPDTQARPFHERLTAAGVPSTLVLVQHAGHGFAPSGGRINPSRADLNQMIVDFFDRTLRRQ